MFHSCFINNEINWLHERFTRLIYGDKTPLFDELLEQDKSVWLYTKNLQMLATKMFKVLKYASSCFQCIISST